MNAGASSFDAGLLYCSVHAAVAIEVAGTKVHAGWQSRSIVGRHISFGNSVTEWSSNILAGQGEPRQAAATIEFEDAALVDRCRKGDMRAFGALAAKYQDRVINTVLHLCGNQADAEELAQETFLKALERLRQFRGQASFYTWLFRIAVNLALSHRRRGKRIRFNPLEPGDNPGESLAVTADLAARRQPSPPVEAMSAETARRVADAIDQLDDDFRLVVVLRDVEDMDYDQISQTLNVPAGTVKSRLHRARCMLKVKLADLMP